MNLTNPLPKPMCHVYLVNLAGFITGTKNTQPVEQLEQVFVISESCPDEQEILERILASNLLYSGGVANWLAGDIEPVDMAIEYHFDDVQIAHTVESVRQLAINSAQLNDYVSTVGVKQPIVRIPRPSLRHFHVHISCHVKDHLSEHAYLMMSSYSRPELLMNFFNYMWWHYNSESEDMAHQLDEPYGQDYLAQGKAQWNEFLNTGTFDLPYIINGISCQMQVTAHFTEVDQSFMECVEEIKKTSNAIYILNSYDSSYPAGANWESLLLPSEKLLNGLPWLTLDDPLP